MVYDSITKKFLRAADLTTERFQRLFQQEIIIHVVPFKRTLNLFKSNSHFIASLNKLFVVICSKSFNQTFKFILFKITALIQNKQSLF